MEYVLQEEFMKNDEVILLKIYILTNTDNFHSEIASKNKSYASFSTVVLP